MTTNRHIESTFAVETHKTEHGLGMKISLVSGHKKKLMVRIKGPVSNPEAVYFYTEDADPISTKDIEQEISVMRGLETGDILQLDTAQNITCLADIERLVAEDVKQSGKPGPRIVTIGTHTQKCLADLEKSGRIPLGTLSFRNPDQLVFLRSHHAEQFLSIQRIPEEKEQITHSVPTTQCCFCKATDTLDRITITSEHHGWSKLGKERAHSVCANTWRELTAGNRTDLLCAVLCDFYYSTEGMTNLEHYADQLCETLLQLDLIYKHQAGQWSAYYITDLGKAFFKKVLVAPFYKPVPLKVQVDRLALYAESKGLTPHWLYLGRKQQHELADWLPSTPQNPVNKFHTAGGMVEVIRIRKTDDMFLHGYTQTQPEVKEYSEAITLEDVANQK